MYSGLSKHHALLEIGVSISNTTPAADRGGGPGAGSTELWEPTVLSSAPSGFLEDSLHSTKKNTCKKKKASAGQAGEPWKKILLISGQMLPILSGERIRVEQRKAPAQAILSLGSPNTNLPYVVTMETGAACQSYFTDKVSCRQQPLGWEGLRGEQSPFPQVPQSPLEDQPPCEVGALSDTEWPGWGGWGVARSLRRKICLPGTRFCLFQGHLEHNAAHTSTPLPSLGPAQKQGVKPHTQHTPRCSQLLSSSPGYGDTAQYAPISTAHCSLKAAGCDWGHWSKA